MTRRGLTTAERRARQRVYQRRYAQRHADYMLARQRAYGKTAKGYIMRAYCNMVGRVKGRVKPHLYKGLPILTKDEFYAWCFANPQFITLFRAWVRSGYMRALSPSVNRIDTTRGYTLENIEWVTQGMNSGLANVGRHRAAERTVIHTLVKRSLTHA